MMERSPSVTITYRMELDAPAMSRQFRHLCDVVVMSSRRRPDRL